MKLSLPDQKCTSQRLSELVPIQIADCRNGYLVDHAKKKVFYNRPQLTRNPRGYAPKQAAVLLNFFQAPP
jgi:hypothetical protein